MVDDRCLLIDDEYDDISFLLMFNLLVVVLLCRVLCRIDAYSMFCMGTEIPYRCMGVSIISTRRVVAVIDADNGRNVYLTRVYKSI